MIIKPQYLFFTFVITTCMNAQDLPYRELPEPPEVYTAGNVVSRMVDGLGFRYYWATEGLTEKDLAFKPSDDARSALQTLQHIYGMSEIILNVPDAQPNKRPMEFSGYTFADLRKMTLENLKKASAKYQAGSAEDMNAYRIIFQRGENQSDFPFWNMLNGMLSDCIYHVGQIVSFRRSSGNPMNPNVSVFQGKVRE